MKCAACKGASHPRRRPTELTSCSRQSRWITRSELSCQLSAVTYRRFTVSCWFSFRLSSRANPLQRVSRGTCGPPCISYRPELGRVFSKQLEAILPSDAESDSAYSTQSAMKMLVSCGTLPLRFDAHTSRLPSEVNMGKASKSG